MAMAAKAAQQEDDERRMAMARLMFSRKQQQEEQRFLQNPTQVAAHRDVHQNLVQNPVPGVPVHDRHKNLEKHPIQGEDRHQNPVLRSGGKSAPCLDLGRTQDSCLAAGTDSERVPAAPEEEITKNGGASSSCEKAGETSPRMLALGLPGPALPQGAISRKHAGIVQQQGAILEAEEARPLAFRLASSPGSSPALVTPICTRGQVYPPPLATHEEVIRDPVLFMDTLCKFHEAMGSRMTTPRMGGSQLDLYRLYQEVTARGGLEQVIKDRLWKDIKAVFNFPKTTTSASFVLRKYYTSLLHHYEQVYFFRTQGQLVSPPAPLPAPSPVLHSPENGTHSEDSELGPKLQKRRFHPPVDIDPAAHIGDIVTGSIEEKFEHGYLVTVVVGSEKFRGVLYHVPAGSSAQQFIAAPTTTTMGNAVISEANETANVGVRIRRRRRRLGLRRKDPSAPKLNRSGYNFFFAEQRARLKLVHPDKDREISKMIGESWSSMTEEQKSPYQERGIKDKERYKREMRDYRERTKTPQKGEAEGMCTQQPQQQQQQDQVRVNNQQITAAVRVSAEDHNNISHPHQDIRLNSSEVTPSNVLSPSPSQQQFQTETSAVS